MTKFSKRILPLILAVFALMLSSCDGVMKVNPDNLNLNKASVFAANIEYEEFSAKAEFKREKEYSWMIAMTEPYAMNGLVYTYKNGEITASFGGLEGAFTDSAQEYAVYKLIADAFDNAYAGAKNSRTAAATKTEYRVSGKTGEYGYELVLDKKTKKPLSMTIPDIELTAEFSEAAAPDYIGMYFENDQLEDNE